MKKILLGLCFTPFFFTSCQKDEIPRYDVRDEYVGFYNATDACDATLSDYELEVYKSSNYDDIIFAWPGLYEAGFEVSAIVTGMKIIVPIQQFYVSTYPEIFYEFSGSGALDGNVLKVDYTVLIIQNGLIVDENNCIATLTRQ